MISFFNTKTRKVEEFQSIEKGKVGIYSCGPTVYATQHIGNMRAYVTWDILRRALEANDFEVTQIMNVTDVGHLFEEGEEAKLGEDKLEYAAKLSGRSAWMIAKYYSDEFLKFLDELNIRPPTHLVKATDNIKEQIQLIEILESKGFTYKTSDGVYFDTSKFPKYGELAGSKSGIKAGARVEMVVGKKNSTDFALWKFSPSAGSGLPKRQMEWDSPWAPRGARGKVKGFPGWHIECSAMALKYLGNAFENGNFRPGRSRIIDIHTGGIDHIPVHHTNEIAQSEAATGKEFVRFWLHNEFVLVAGGKMSKSLGNVYTLHDVKKKGFEPLALRYLFLTTHYRDKLNFTWDSLKAAQTAYDRLVEMTAALNTNTRSTLSQDKFQLIEKYRTGFFNQINNDLRTPGALAILWGVVKSNIPNKDKYELLLAFDEVLGLRLEQRAESKSKAWPSGLEQRKLPDRILKLVNEREELRKENKWDEADKIRVKIEDMGYLIKDTPEGPCLIPKKGLPDA